jgi:GAF domain-containing protein
MLSELKDRLFDQGKRNEFLKILETIYHSDESNLEVLETLCNAYNEMNREDGLRRSLSRLFNLYLTTENYNKAADALERILDVEPYGAGHNDRLMSLEGHIDSTWYKSIHARLQPPSGRTAPAVNARAAATDEADSLEDLLIEGEMYHQYQLAAKLTETLKKIDRLFPGAHEKNQKLSELYDAAGYTPKYKAPQAAALAPTPQPDGVTAATESIQSLHDVRKISEITANIYRESTPQGVLQVAVDEIGRAMNASRCWGAVGSPDTPPALMAEYCSPLASPSDPTAATRLFAFLIEQTASRPEGFSAENAARAALLFEVGAEIQRLGIRSLLALPLIDKDAAAGLLLVEQCDSPRSWSAGEALLLKSVGTQLVIAINNTKLRRLARSLAGTDPDTGLLPRSVYLECLLSEARRSKERSQPLSVCLLEPEGPQVLMKSLGDAGVRSFVLQLGKALAPVLRQNDIAIRYSPLSVAVVFPDTALPQAGFAVEKVRRVLTQVRVNNFGADNFCAAVCDVPLGADFDVVDGVTEVINRLESCLARAHKEGGDRILISRFSV